MKKTHSLDDLISKKAVEFADQIKFAAAMADKEEDIRIAVERQLAFIERETDVKLEGKHEFTVASGLVDSVYDRVIIEYKNPKSPADRIGPKADSPGSKKVVKQIEDRFYDMRAEHGQPLNTLFGVGLDGNRFVFVRFRDDKWQVQEPVEVNRYSAERFLWALFNLGTKGKPFSPEYLADDFGSEAKLAQEGIHALYDAIVATDNPKANTFFSQWRILFGEVCGYDVDNPSDKIKKLAEFYHVSVRGFKPAELLFAVHTYYALFMKLLASEIVAFFHKLPTPLQKMMRAGTSNKLKQEMEDLEAGSIFRHLNITNFLEGDLFAWYTAVWSEPIEKLVRDMVARLDNYNPGTLSEDPAGSRDLLKKLYQQLFPKSVRHDLGEYYTPDWLAEHVLNELGYVGDPNKRLLDPACGSGTFLVMAINRIRHWYDENREKYRFGEDDLCRKILSNVIGFDLNPLAVMAARTNYLIAIRDLIGHVDRVEIPIYLCDSILTPSEYGEEKQEELFGKPMKLTTSAKPTPFLIPREVTTDREVLATYTGLLADLSRAGSGYTAEDFVKACVDEGIQIKQVGDHRLLFQEIRELDKTNRNGVWARIIKNAFAPLFIGQVDFVTGNPPWINWDSLPDDYRNATKPLWIKNKLFTLGGTAGKLGGGKKDIAMLFVYEGLRSYLKPKGRLGYVITQSIFKTEGAADGFRQFQLPASSTGPAEPFCVYKVDDLSRLKPFEGAANRTAVLCIEKGSKTRYPIHYPYWLPIDSASIPDSTELPAVLASTKRLGLKAAPIYDRKLTAPWLSVCPKVLDCIRSAVGTSAYKAQAGATTCGADGVFLVRPLRKISTFTTLIENIFDGGRRAIPKREGQVADEYLYPVCRGKDISKWLVKTEMLILMLQDPETRVGIEESVLKRHHITWNFVSEFKKELQSRKSSMLPKHPFYSVYGVDRNSFAPFKVVWGRVGVSVAAAVVGKESSYVGRKVVLPFEAMMIPFEEEEEAHYVCGCLNSAPAQLIVVGSIVLHPDTHVMRRVNIPKFNRKDATHVRIASLAKEAHEVMKKEQTNNLSNVESELARMAGKLWGIAALDVDAIERCLSQILDGRCYITAAGQ